MSPLQTRSSSWLLARWRPVRPEQQREAELAGGYRMSYTPIISANLKVKTFCNTKRKRTVANPAVPQIYGDSVQSVAI